MKKDRLNKLHTALWVLTIFFVFFVLSFGALRYARSYALSHPRSSAPQSSQPQAPEPAPQPAPSFPNTKTYVAPDGSSIILTSDDPITPELEQKLIAAAREGTARQNSDGSWIFLKDGEGMISNIQGDVMEQRSRIVSSMTSGVTR